MNDCNDFRIVSASMACRKMSLDNVASSSGTKLRYTLGEVAATNIVLDVNVGSGWTRIRLKEVPRFLVHAFNMISEFGMEVDGIFRKEGNSARLSRAEVKNIYRGICDIPSDYTVIDVCTMVKRFLRDLKPPLLDSEEFRDRLLKRGRLAKISGQYVLDTEEMADLFFESKERPEPLLSDIHSSTLGYVMRQLVLISRQSDKHKMSIDNLAVVLVGSVFGDRIHNPKKNSSIQGRRFSQDDMLARKKQDMDVHVSAVKILITNANLICVRRDPYIVSSAMVRSSSAMPSMSRSDGPSSTATPLPSTSRKESTSPTPSFSRRDSEPVHKIILSGRKKDKQKRSSSFLPSFRDIRHRFVKQRVKSPSPARAVEVIVNEDTTTSSIDETRRVARNNSKSSTASGRQSRSQQSRRGNTNSTSSNARPKLDKVFEPLRRVSASEQNTRLSNEKISVNEFLMSEYMGNVKPSENLSSVTNGRKSNRNRRHTAPVNNGLRRNRPNTVAGGLPQRRATIYTTVNGGAEKENSMINSETEEDDDDSLTRSKKLLEQKAMEARNRKANLKEKRRHQQKTVSTESMMVLNGSIAKADSNPSIEDEDREDKATNKALGEVKKMCDMATSPMVFDMGMTSPKSHENGHVCVYSKVVIEDSPVIARRQSRARLSYSKANDTNPILSPVMRHVAQINNSPPIITTSTSVTPRTTLSPLVIKQILDDSPSVSESSPPPPPPVPPHSPPMLTPQTSKAAIDVVARRPPTPPANPRVSDPFSPKLPVRSLVNLEKTPPPPAMAQFKLPQMPIMKRSPLTHQPQSLISLREPPRHGQQTYHQQSSVPLSAPSHILSGNEGGMSPRSCEYFEFGKYSSILKSAKEPKSLPRRQDFFDARPSVAVIRSKNSGMVRNRINQFQEIERSNESISSGRSSQLSVRTSDRLSDASSSNDTTLTTANFDVSSSSGSQHRF
ncbi:unnamed protein product [Caenorhabditis angaria]|uniref:Rho-GAP domain-containing protein n=1 Tax=Caenorhabditis angaria TaxID=860376 RepID=A0A9P1IYH9_9PELO|nr:unnamed protein product [Caenorhabditis angaria]